MEVPLRSDYSNMRLLCRCMFFFAAASTALGLDLNTIGVNTLRTFEPGLTGAAVRVAQPEASAAPGQWQVDPAAVGHPVTLFTWIASGGSATTFPNGLGSASPHANSVGMNFYGSSTGVAPGVAHVDNYDAGFFINSIIANQTSIPARVVNQSFVNGSEDPMLDRDYDRYAVRYNVLFVSGAGNGGAVQSPSTAYNSISVGALGGLSSVGPTLNGRCKPDITVPDQFTSFSTPQVAGAAAILLQAAARGDGGAGTTSDLSDIRSVKALLLNGAQKPVDWTNSSSNPLDFRYGAGVLNVFQSYRQLRAGRKTASLTQTISVGGSHLPPAATNEITSRRGWDFAAASSSVTSDWVGHYFFNVTGTNHRAFTATLVWIRQTNQMSINDLDLFLYRAPDNTVVASSVSPVDNVEHLSISNLPPGHYDLQVFKSGNALKRVANNETYALAFDFGQSQAPVFGPPSVAGGQFTTRLTGEPNQRYRIDASTALGNWSPVLTNTTTSAGTLDISLPAPGTRFRRALELP